MMHDRSHRLAKQQIPHVPAQIAVCDDPDEASVRPANANTAETLRGHDLLRRGAGSWNQSESDCWPSSTFRFRNILSRSSIHGRAAEPSSAEQQEEGIHRKEGDHGNASYWHNRAGKPRVPRAAGCGMAQHSESITVGRVLIVDHDPTCLLSS